MKFTAVVLAVALVCVSAVTAQTVKVRILSKPAPNYTNEARDAGLEGAVILRVTFRSDGTIGDIVDATKKDRDQFERYGLTENAVKAAKSIKFEPKTVDGVAVTVRMSVEYRFDIH